MKIESLKNLNITLLLESIIDHNAVANKQVFGVVSENTDDLEHVVMEGPDIKIFQFPKLDYNLIIESKRLLVNDKSGKQTQDSKIVSMAISLYKTIGGKPKAYGFNFDYIVSDSDFLVNKILGTKLSGMENIREVGASIRFDQDNVDIGLDIKPVKGKVNEFTVHVNVNHNSIFNSNEKELKQQLSEAEEISKEVISKI